MISNEIRNDLKTVCTVLNKHHVDCMLVGGTAVGFYGYQRISGISTLNPEIKTDLDFWYNPTIENFIAILKSLRELKIDTVDLEKIFLIPTEHI